MVRSTNPLTSERVSDIATLLPDMAACLSHRITASEVALHPEVVHRSILALSLVY